MLEKAQDEVEAFIEQAYSDITGKDLKEFLDLLGQAAMPDFQHFEEELATDNLNAAADAAHRVRNFTQAVGAAELSASLLSMEAALRAGNRGSVGMQLEQIRADYMKLVSLIIHLAKKTTPGSDV